MRNVSLAMVTLLGVLTLSCVKQQAQQRMTAEEAGWHGEIEPVVAAMCAVGSSKQVVVAYTRVRCGYGETCAAGTKTVPLYAKQSAASMPAPTEKSEEYWRDTRERMAALLPPSGVEELQTAILQTLDAQLALNDSTSAFNGDQRAELLERLAGATCAQYNKFQASVLARRAPPAELSAQTFAVSFQPVGSPATFGLNSKGQFFMSVSDSIPTPYGEISFSSSKSTASPTKPKRLVVRANGRERVLYMDRDFEVFVPAVHGVRVVNTDTDLILDVDMKVPAENKSASRKKTKRRSA